MNLLAAKRVPFLGPRILLVILLGFAMKFYRGPGASWTQNYGAAVFYEIFWILLTAFWIRPDRWGILIPLFVFTATSALEFLQLWHPFWLEEIRSHFIGRTLLGTDFDPWDFPHYALGCFWGWRMTRSLN